MTDWPFKRCVGTHCNLRDNCVHHALPTSDTRGLIWPVEVGESCRWYESKKEFCPWGIGAEPND